MTQDDMVLEFHDAFNHPINVDPSNEEINLRKSLIDEEATEAYQEFVNLLNPREVTIPLLAQERKETLAALTKELADILYVVWGTAISFGLPLEEVFRRVHESNMSKLGDDGKPIYREDGKVLKGPNYKPVDLRDLFE